MQRANEKSVTGLLQDWAAGDAAALENLVPIVYQELRRAARKCLQAERPGHTLETTGLVNEAYLRLQHCGRVRWHDRAHFFSVATRLMRRALVDAARQRGRHKRGGGATRVELPEVSVPEKSVDVIALDRALERLASIAPRKARVVEMRFFGGLTIEETAAALDVSEDIVKREWRTAKLWLSRELSGTGLASNSLAHD